MKIIVRPILDPRREIDLTHRLVAAIAEELWRLFGGNDELNWMEAEWHLQRIIAQARSEAHEARQALVAPAVPDRAISRSARPVRREYEAAGLSALVKFESGTGVPPVRTTDRRDACPTQFSDLTSTELSEHPRPRKSSPRPRKFRPRPRPRNGVRRAKQQRAFERAANRNPDAPRMTGAALANA